MSVPPLTPPANSSPADDCDFDEFAIETHEWLSLIALESPRINPNDRVDSFLSRYAPPDPSTAANLVKVTWHGFLSPTWAHKTFAQILLAVARKGWFSYSVGGFDKGWEGESKDCTILKLPHAPDEYLLWEVFQ